MKNIKRSISPAQSIEEAGGTLIDVRPSADYKKFHPLKSISLPLERFLELCPTLLPDKQKPVGVSCATGHKSAIACMFLRDMGYRYVYDLGGDHNKESDKEP